MSICTKPVLIGLEVCSVWGILDVRVVLGRATCGFLWLLLVKGRTASLRVTSVPHHRKGVFVCVFVCVCCRFFPSSLAEQILDLTSFPRFQCFPIRKTDPPIRLIKSLELLCHLEFILQTDSLSCIWKAEVVLALMHDLFTVCKSLSILVQF